MSEEQIQTPVPPDRPPEITPESPLGAADSVEMELLKLAVEAWEKTVDVQQHFNDITLRVRSLAIGVLVGAIGASGVAAEGGHSVLALGVLSVGVVGWGAFFIMDRHWYHFFLIAAGVHAGSIEARWAKVLPEMGLSTAISKASGSVTFRRWPSRKKKTMRSVDRLEYFYRLGWVALGIGAIAVLLAGPGQHLWYGWAKKAPLPSRATAFPLGLLPNPPRDGAFH